MKMMQDLSIFVIIFLIKKKCTHLRSAITKANFEYLFQHRHFFHRLTLMMILYLYWKGSGKIYQIRIFFKKEVNYIFLVMIDRVFLSKIMLYLQD